MLKNYFKIAWRSLVKRKFYSALNIAGLALGVACFMLIYLYITYHNSFDTYHANANKIYRLVNVLHLDKTEYEKGSSIAMLRALQKDFPQVQKAAISISKQSFVVNIEGNSNKRFKEDKTVTFTDADWFKTFSYQWVIGSAAGLDEPNTAVLTQRQACKYFGKESPVGKVFSINHQQIKVVGLIADEPYNTDLNSDIYLSLSTFKNVNPKVENNYFTDWGYIMSVHNSFVVLNSTNQQKAVESQLKRMISKRLGADANKYYTFKLLPLKEMHFDTRYGGTVQKSLLYTLAAIGTLIILIAGINYVNMTIAQQARRSVEIGTRKVLGGSTFQLFMQFMAESFLTAFLAVIIAVVLVWLTIPQLNQTLFTDQPLHIVSYKNFYLFCLQALFLITIGTGIYPALLLSRMSIFKAIKNNVWNLSAGTNRKILVVIQNVVAQALIVGTIVIVKQVQFLRNTDKGFNRDFVMTIPLGETSASQKEQLNQSLRNMPDVQSFSYCHRSPASESMRGSTVMYNGRWQDWPARYAIGDSAYCKTFGIKVVAGRNIRSEQAVPEFLVNETMAIRLSPKNPSDVVNKNLVAGDGKGVIVGIVKDFNVRSLLEPIEPSVLLEDKFAQTNLAIKLSDKHNAQNIDQLKNIYQRVFPDQVFAYQFVDEQIAMLYKKEILQQKLIGIAATVAIIISSLGLLGLVSLITLQRTKEIGIRKVLGASVARIGVMLSTELLQMVIIAVLIAVPISLWAMHQWLQNFVYRIHISWWVYALAGCTAILIALITVSLQSVKAAMANPVKSLRSE
ncbi:ABC transporter permease [Mucilaginibacter lacusdianchii]|uniref:ABC transporter permease n=1 Tax=Mucilaginibacter lacusdianchii TaxID=2684211 RepID=UPI00131BB9A8|nr:ABC transporter permease [Mucilaginibacter sp. JXJ CY 39]